MANNSFEKLEKLNAQIDVWIDDERYDDVVNGIVLSETKPKGENGGNFSIKEALAAFFDKGDPCTDTEDKKSEWQKLLSIPNDEIPFSKVIIKDLDRGDWTHLFYTKLLRAKIQQRGDSDCYTRRLDDVTAYLERNLPELKLEDDESVKLTLVYLMELSAVSMDWESLGYSERARRLIRDAKYSLDRAHKSKSDKKLYCLKAPYEFYELWARYNIGVAYFHKRRYHQAVLEFNRIIWQVKKWEGEKKNGDKGAEACLKFFPGSNDRDKVFKGEELLRLPAKLYRTEVQLKLQLAYHALQTLNKHEKESENPRVWGSEHKQVKANIIKAQAYQLLGRLDKSWEDLCGICQSLTHNTVDLKERSDCVYPKEAHLKKYPSLAERFFDILIDDHLGWLLLEGDDDTKPAPSLSRLVKYGMSDEGVDPCEDYVIAVRELEKGYLKKLNDAFSEYWKLVEHHADNRKGYFQQVAKYLAWLAKAADFKYSDPSFARGQGEGVKKAREKIADIAINLYKNNSGLLFDEDELDTSQGGCCHCAAKGIDLRRIEDEHYTWFTKAMLEFFNSTTVKEALDKKAIKKDKECFVNRLGQLERKARDNLRVNDLELRYDYWEPEKLLKEGETDGERLCGGNLPEWVTALKGLVKLCRGYARGCLERLIRIKGNCLLSCSGPAADSQSDSSLAPPYDYEKIMKEWDEYFIRHLKAPSRHERAEARRFYFMGLQRWNSSSPAKGYSLGGGYLLYHLDKDKQVDMGIAIDPGFDFVRNLFHSGFSLDDIDIVLISHAHLDHIRDFESIVMLLSELKKRVQRERRVHVILSLGSYKRLEHIVEDPNFRYRVEPYIIDMEREIDDDYFEKLGGQDYNSYKFEGVTPQGKKAKNRRRERFQAILPEDKNREHYYVEIVPTRAYHRDYTHSDSFGFLIKLKGDSKGKEVKEIVFGYTGDTKWVYPDMPDPFKDDGKERLFRDVADQYEDCDALVVHLGSLIQRDKDDGEYDFSKYNQCVTKGDYPCEKMVREENHPYLVGMLRLLSKLSRPPGKGSGVPLVLVSEFGEEMRGHIRCDFIKRLGKIYHEGLAFLPVDVGMNVKLCRKDKDGKLDTPRGNKCSCSIRCVQCQQFVNISDAGFEKYGTDHALYCVCKTCLKGTPADVLQTTLRKLYEVGYDINTDTDDDNKHP